MGQCVLRDFGCDFEKDQEKKKVLNDFLKEVHLSNVSCTNTIRRS